MAEHRPKPRWHWWVLMVLGLAVILAQLMQGCTAYQNMKTGFAETQYPGSKAAVQAQKAPKR